MRCEDVMQTEVKCAELGETVRSAAVRMRDENIGFLPVCDQDGRVLGTLTDRDIAIRVDAEGLSAGAVRVGDVMTAEVVSCRRADELSRAEEIMAAHRKSRIIVVDPHGKICGVISLSDVAAFEGPRRAAAILREIASREIRF